MTRELKCNRAVYTNVRRLQSDIISDDVDILGKNIAGNLKIDVNLNIAVKKIRTQKKKTQTFPIIHTHTSLLSHLATD